MASRTRTLLRFIAVVAAGLVALALRSPAAARNVHASGATPAEVRDTGWALSIYADAGLQLPDLRFVFHETDEECRGNRGVLRAGHRGGGRLHPE